MSGVVDIARVTVDAFSNDDWDAYRAALAPGSVYHEFATGRRVEGPDAVVEASRSWKQALPGRQRHGHQRPAIGTTAVRLVAEVLDLEYAHGVAEDLER